MGKRMAVILVSMTLVVGVGLGVLGHWFFAEKLPRDRAMAAAKKQQEEMNKMVRSGEVVSVSKSDVTVKVQNSGDQDLLDKVISFRVDPNTTIQQGSELLNPNRQGDKIDITKYLVKGTRVDVLGRDIEGEDRNKTEAAVAIHWIAPAQEEPVQGKQVAQKQKE